MSKFLVTSAATKVIAKVPATSRTAQFPKDCVVSPYGKGNANPVFVAHNATDKGKEVSPGVREFPNGTYQGIEVDQFLIINEVNEDAAKAFLAILGDENYDIETLDKASAYLADAGFRDQYSTDLAFVQSKLSPAGSMLGTTAGQVKRDDRDTMQLFRKDSGIYVSHADGTMPKAIEEDILLRTYKCADGSPIQVKDIPVVS